VLTQAKRWKEAIADYDFLVTPGTKDAELLSAAAFAHLKGGMPQVAEEYCRRLLALRQDNWTDWHYLGWALGAQDRRKESIDAYGKAIELDPKATESYAGRADEFTALRHWELALEGYDKAIELAATSERWRYHDRRGRLWAQQGEWQKAAEDFAKLEGAPASDKEWWMTRDRALATLVLNDVKAYRAAALQTRQLVGDQATAFQARWLAQVLIAKEGMIAKANLTPSLALAARADKFHAPRLAAALHFRAGHLQQAVDGFAKDPGSPEYQFLAAMALHKLGRPDDARKLLDEASRWMQEQRDTKPGEAIPVGSWQEWALCLILQREATARLAAKSD
jgi:tetratricopeptide (TPR) repeat protein